MNTTDCPADTARPSTRDNVVLTGSELPTNPNGATDRLERTVVASAIATGVVAVSAMTGKAPVWSAKKAAAFRNEAVAA